MESSTTDVRTVPVVDDNPKYRTGPDRFFPEPADLNERMQLLIVSVSDQHVKYPQQDIQRKAMHGRKLSPGRLCILKNG